MSDLDGDGAADFRVVLKGEHCSLIVANLLLLVERSKRTRQTAQVRTLGWGAVGIGEGDLAGRMTAALTILIRALRRTGGGRSPTGTDSPSPLALGRELGCVHTDG